MAKKNVVKFTSTKLKPLNPKQRKYMNALTHENQVFVEGGAGTGKTYIAARHGARAVADGKYLKLVIARPTVARSQHRLGHIPGDIKEKMMPWLAPLIAAIRAELGRAQCDRMVREEQIEFVSFEHLRGVTLSNAVIILDEAQNCDTRDFHLFLTRVGEHSQLVVCGDAAQTDIRDSGFCTILRYISEYDLSATVIQFEDKDVVRSEIAKEWVGVFTHAKD